MNMPQAAAASVTAAKIVPDGPRGIRHVGLVVGFLLTGIAAPAQANASVWFARAGAVGDGTTAASPIGSSEALAAATRPGDVIILLPGGQPFDGGVALKKGQTLMGLAGGEGGGDRKPSITNTTSDRNGGNGVVLADDCRVLNVRIERVKASGVLGVDVSGACLLGVEVEDANQSAGFTSAVASVLGPISHGGILFIAAKAGKAVENRVLQCTVTNATGVGIGSFALGGGRSRLFVSQTCARGGAAVPPLFDMGVIALAEGRSSEMHLEMADVTVSGRLSQQGRNVVVFATAEAKAIARIERSTLGESGQDGVVAVVARVPATARVEIRDSTIEKAGQMNIEGSILNVPASDPARAHESVVSIDVEGSTVRDVGAVDGFRGEAQNIWLGPTVFGPGPFARGRYRLSVRNSTIEKAFRTGIGLGNEGSEFKIAPDEGEYRVRLRDNTIRDNGSSEITISATNARIDARRNDWGAPEGLAEKRVLLLEKTKRSQLDASEPLSRSEQRTQNPPR
jgi:hypothetical protein